jgi:predicted glycogen debranching enzyme
MSYLKFDKPQMTNLQESLYKEILLTNKSGAYASTTLVGCNIRKYHGLLTVPIPDMGNRNHVLLSSLDETVIQHGAEFNLSIHKYQGDNYSPKGHKYINHFEWDKVPTTTYRVGGVVLQKEITFQAQEPRILIRYTLVDAHSKTRLRLKPFLAFRSANSFTHENWAADLGYTPVSGGIAMCLYSGYPTLYMQLNKKSDFIYNPQWYRGLDYPRERERGYDSNEDLVVPGYFEFDIRKGEQIVFSAGLNEIHQSQMKKQMDKGIESHEGIGNFYQCLVHAAHQFKIKKGDDHLITAGWPWFKCRARDMLVSMPGLTLYIGENDLFEKYMETMTKALHGLISGTNAMPDVNEIEKPDVPLWAIWCVQQYAKQISQEECYRKYGNLLLEIALFILKGKHPNLFVHENGLIYSNGRENAVTWMNSTIDGKPLVPRSGYIVEFNALWYNDIKFLIDIFDKYGTDNEKTVLYQLKKLATNIESSFSKTFLNKYGYLFDYVDGTMADWSVRPNQIFAVALDYSPLSPESRKSVLDICTRELVTPKGLRSLSPKSSGYDPTFAGSPQQRDRCYHQGTAWPWLMGFYLEAYLNVYKRSGLSYIERQLIGFDEELSYHCIGTLPELFDGDPPFHGRGAYAYAMSVSSILRAERLLEKYNKLSIKEDTL